MTMEVFVLGTGGMMPLPGRHLTSVLVRRGGELFLFDCGEGTQVSLRRLNLRWKKISVIFISHTHADHVTGLPGILMLSSQVDRDDPLTIIGPPKIAEYIEANRRILEMYINYRIDVIEYTGPGVVYRGEGFQVRAFPLRHSKICVGYTLEEERRPGIFYPDKALGLGVPRGPLWSRLQGGNSVKLENGITIHSEQVMGQTRSGRKFSFVTDTLPSPNIAEFVKDSDLLICEGMFTEELIESATEKRHLTAGQAAEIALEGKVKSMGLIHYSPRYTKRELNQLLEEARAIFPNSFLTTDRQLIKLPFRD
jgi:ribonuclease Z